MSHAWSSPGSSGAATPTSASGGSTFLSSSAIYSTFGGLMRRLSSDPAGHMSSSTSSLNPGDDPGDSARNNGTGGVYNPRASRTASPMRPPPLEPLVLHGFHPDTPASARLLNSAVAEEIRIMVPERLRIEEDWALVYSLDQDGASLATLYKKCAAFEGRRGGFILVVRDDDGGTFGAYLSEYPHPSPHYFGTGECFLWRASLLASLPPPPSADTADLTGRTTTIRPRTTAPVPPLIPELVPQSTGSTAQPTQMSLDSSSPSLLSPTPASSISSLPARPASPSIRFKAFPYSGVNEYYAYCDAHCLSVGGGDGKYGLWLDDGLEKGVSSTCLTFGNEPLSDEGDKFGVLGVEVWVIGAKNL